MDDKQSLDDFWKELTAIYHCAHQKTDTEIGEELDAVNTEPMSAERIDELVRYATQDDRAPHPPPSRCPPLDRPGDPAPLGCPRERAIAEGGRVREVL